MIVCGTRISVWLQKIYRELISYLSLEWLFTVAQTVESDLEY